MSTWIFADGKFGNWDKGAADVDILAALHRAPGAYLRETGADGTVLREVNAMRVLREFARWCALQVVDLWDTPDVVRQYLETGDAALWQAANSAAIEVEGRWVAEGMPSGYPYHRVHADGLAVTLYALSGQTTDGDPEPFRWPEEGQCRVYRRAGSLAAGEMESVMGGSSDRVHAVRDAQRAKLLSLIEAAFDAAA